MGNNRNFYLTIALSVLILTVWQVFYMNPRIEAQRQATKIEQQQTTDQQQTAPADQAVGGTPAATPPVTGAGGANAPAGTETRPAAVASSQRVRIDTPKLIGSINLTGARLDDLSLKDYHETVDDNSPIIQLLNPAQLKDGYFAELGYSAAGNAGDLPGENTVWKLEKGDVLTPSTPVTLSYTNSQGLTFERRIAVDDNYMFTVADTIVNAGSAPVTLSGYGRVTRFNKPDDRSTYVLHEGLIAVTGSEGLQEIKYDKIKKEKQVTPGKSTDGWLGITDKYWAVALVPRDSTAFQPHFGYYDNGGRERWQSDYLDDPVTVSPGQSQTLETLVFAGAKQVSTINAYEKDDNIRQFDLLIDWGWFYFITKPMFWLMDSLFKLFGNFGLAILATTVLVKLLFFPLANKSYQSMAKMKKLQPLMTEMREKYGDDKVKQQQAMMELYKKEKVNPIAGCWPMLLQVPVFFSLYKVLYVTIEMRHAPFFGWIQDLASPDPTSVFNLFGLLPYHVPPMLMIGVWPLIMGFTMFLQMRMQPTPPDPTQKMIFTWMPVVFTFMLARFPAGLVIYWAWNNTLSIIQQSVIMKRSGVKIELWGNLAQTFVPKKRKQPAE